MKKALIGNTGFVGSNLLNQFNFDDVYNSKNLASIKDKEYDELYCAAPSAIKWIANKDPINDIKSVIELVENVSKAKIKKLYLFSSVDVYSKKINVNEETKIDIKKSDYYGRNRYILETYLSNSFDTKIIRLPALFGKGIKKNALYDLLNNNQLENICLQSEFQWFNLKELKNIINYINNMNIKCINVTSEPIKMLEIVNNFFQEKISNCISNKKIEYDINTIYYKNKYFYNKKQILYSLEEFIKTYDINN
jgi:nucleoside-diphosphate-sugar epimerase